MYKNNLYNINTFKDALNDISMVCLSPNSGKLQ